MPAVVVKLAEKIASGAKDVLTTFVVIVKRQVLFMFVRVVVAGRVQTVMKVLSAELARLGLVVSRLLDGRPPSLGRLWSTSPQENRFSHGTPGEHAAGCGKKHALTVFRFRHYMYRYH